MLFYFNLKGMMDELIDYHAGEPDEKSSPFGYAVYFENIRHTLNMNLKKTIKHRFSNNGSKFIIQVQK